MNPAAASNEQHQLHVWVCIVDEHLKPNPTYFSPGYDEHRTRGGSDSHSDPGVQVKFYDKITQDPWFHYSFLESVLLSLASVCLPVTVALSYQ
jgi:hypothetical protein